MFVKIGILDAYCCEVYLW